MTFIACSSSKFWIVCKYFQICKLTVFVQVIQILKYWYGVGAKNLPATVRWFTDKIRGVSAFSRRRRTGRSYGTLCSCLCILPTHIQLERFERSISVRSVQQGLQQSRSSKHSGQLGQLVKSLISPFKNPIPLFL